MQENEIQNIEVRVRRLEQLHIWGVSLIAIGLIFYVVKNK